MTGSKKSRPTKTAANPSLAESTVSNTTEPSAPALFPVWNLLIPGGEQLGEDRIRLLDAIAETGSLLLAAPRCGLSYRTAWSRIRELNSLFPTPLVESIQGGAEGGSTRLSPQAARLVALHREATELFRRAAAQHGLESNDLRALDSFRRRLSMRTSVRNQFMGVVRTVHLGTVNAEIVLDIQDGASIVAQITIASCQALGLKPGMEAWALIKSTWVDIATGKDAPRVSARNILPGKVLEIRKGSVSDEVALTLPGGNALCASISSSATEELGLRKGTQVWALFKASSVILAVN